MDDKDMNSMQYTENGNSAAVIDTKEEVKHSGFGITSFVMAMINVLMIIIMFAISLRAASDVYSVDNSLLITVGIISILSVALSIIGTIFGIIGVCQKNKKKIFGIVGLVINGCELALMILIFSIGFANM